MAYEFVYAIAPRVRVLGHARVPQKKTRVKGLRTLNSRKMTYEFAYVIFLLYLCRKI